MYDVIQYDAVYIYYVLLCITPSSFSCQKVQFFISYLPHQGVYNPVAEAIRKRIARAHTNNETFRVYLVITLLPEVGGTKGIITCILFSVL